MVDRIVIEDEDLARRIQGIARQEQRSVQDVLTAMISQYQPQQPGDVLSEADALARQVRLSAYRRAREYWRVQGDQERASLTDEQLDEQFWLFDSDGIPHLKADKDNVKLTEGSLYLAGQVLATAGYRSGHSDISTRSREILESEYADYLLKQMNRPVDDDRSPAD
jgi:hypothetical protein